MDQEPFRIVVGVDFAETGDLALQRAFDLAAQQAAAELHVAHAVGSSAAHLPVDGGAAPLTAPDAQALHSALRKHVEREAQRWARSGEGGVRCVLHILHDAPARGLAQLASDLDARLIVVGTHGYQGLKRFFLGSVAEDLARVAETGVYIVRPDPLAKVPEVEPPCPRCAEARRASGGQTLWCAQHGERHGVRHTYHYESRNAQPTNFPLVIR